MSAQVPALVLAAGLGTRLDPLTRIVAKPAVPLAGRPLLERVLASLAREGVRDVVINLHHLPHTIAAVAGDGAHLGLRVRYSWEPVILGSAGGPRHALPLLEAQTFLIVNGDTLCDVALAPMIDAHRQTGALVTLAVVPNPARDHYNGLVADASRRVTSFVTRGPGAAGSWHFVGIQVASAAVFAPLADAVPAETVHGIYRDLFAQQPGALRVWPVTVPFIDVGTPRDYMAAARALAGGNPLVEPGASVDPTARVDDCIVWPGATIGPHADLSRCIVAGPVTVPPGFRAARSILIPASLVRPTDAVPTADGIGVFPI